MDIRLKDLQARGPTSGESELPVGAVNGIRGYVALMKVMVEVNMVT
jgi:hypothetical protein